MVVIQTSEVGATLEQFRVLKYCLLKNNFKICTLKTLYDILGWQELQQIVMIIEQMVVVMEQMVMVMLQTVMVMEQIKVMVKVKLSLCFN
jgi:hypothetical protein